MDSWRKPKPGVRHLARAAVVAIAAALCVVLVWPTYLYETYRAHQARTLINEAMSRARPTKGRLYRAPHAEFVPAAITSEELGMAQLVVLGLSNSVEREYLQSLIDLGTRNYVRAATTLEQLVQKENERADLRNDLGVVYIELAGQDSLFLFKALEEFDAASRLEPQAVEPHYNKLDVFRRLQLALSEEAEKADYSRIEDSGPWHDELLKRPVMGEDRVAAEMESALDRKDEAAALAVFVKYPEIARKIAIQYAFNPVEATASSKVAEFVATTIRTRYGDETVTRMLAALDSEYRSDLISARRLVLEGAEAYSTANTDEAAELYDRAAKLIAPSHSSVDEAWLRLNRAYLEIRRTENDKARASLEFVVSVSRNDNLKWLLGQGLTIYGTMRTFNATYGEMLDRLDEAIRICNQIDAPRTAVRAQFYLVAHRFVLGDHEGALRLAVNALSLTDPTDHLRLATLYNHIGVILFKKGFVKQAVRVGDESLYQADASRNAPIIALTSGSLAHLDDLAGRPSEADQRFAKADDAVKRIADRIEQVKGAIFLNNARARVALRRNDRRAQEILLGNLQALTPILKLPAYTEVETLMLLGQSYVLSNSIPDARETFKRALDIAEQDNSFVKTNKLSFDEGWRELYDSAIAFEHEQNDGDAAWNYVQRYQARLFVEMLAQFNPDVEKTHAIAMNRSEVQKALPANTQVVEYALLPDRLLVWVITPTDFQARSVRIRRDDLEASIQTFLASLRAQKPVTQESERLYKTLIEPIANLLDPNKVLAIIPDRALHGLPFGALESPDSGYLISRHAIVVSPTLTHFLAVNAAKPKRDSIVTFGARSSESADSREIGSVQALYRKGASFSGPQVSKATFLSEMERAPIFHYAGHSVHDATDALRSSILLDGEQSGPNNVTAGEIVTHKLLPNALVVLSSCDSSVGSSKDGIGIRGLTSAFLVGGAGAVVGSLWPVEAGSTSKLMIDFHKAYAGEQLPVAQALRKAQLDFIAANPNRSHPYYWSGFMVTGNYSALR